jgi:hypothetical protein
MPEQVVVVEDEVQVDAIPIERELRGSVRVIRSLTSLGLWDRLRERVHIPRRSGVYEFVDVVLFIVAYFANSKHDGGFTDFAARTAGEIGRGLGALAGRMEWMVQSGVSRGLSAVTEECVQGLMQVLQWLWPKAMALHDLMGLGHRDAFGRPWIAIHFDGTVIAERQRQLPKHPNLPKARRRSKKHAAPGHTGRKRGEVVTQRAMTQRAHGAWWVHASLEPGNGDINRMSLAGAKAASDHVAEDESNTRTVFVTDGGSGGWATLRAAVASGLYGLVRCSMYRWLNRTEVRNVLMESGWYAVPDSGSGPSRSAKDVGTWKDATGHVFRVVVSRFDESEAQTERGGSGCCIGNQHYELFLTDLPADAWPAQDVVTLYYDRCGQENCFAMLNRRYDLGKILSEHLEGQAVVTLVGLLVWNVEVLLGAEALGPWDAQHPLLQPKPRHDREVPPPVDVSASVVVSEQESIAHEDREAQEVTPPSANAAASTVVAEQIPTGHDEDVTKVSEIEEDINRHLAQWIEAHSEWKAEGLTLTCPEGAILTPGVRNWNSTSAHIRYRASNKSCSNCKQRHVCSTSKDPAFRKEFSFMAMAHDINEATLARIQQHLRPSGGSLPASIAIPDVQPTQIQPGPYACEMSRLSVAELLHLHDARAAQLICAISVEIPHQTFAALPPAIRPTPAERQHRRKTIEQRVARNDLPAGTTVRISTIRVVSRAPVTAREAA